MTRGTAEAFWRAANVYLASKGAFARLAAAQRRQEAAGEATAPPPKGERDGR